MQTFTLGSFIGDYRSRGSLRALAGKTNNVACYYISVAAEELFSYKFAGKLLKHHEVQVLVHADDDDTGLLNECKHAHTRHCLANTILKWGCNARGC